MSEIIDLKTELVDHTTVHLAIGLHKTKHKSMYLYLPIMHALEKKNRKS